MSSYRVFDPTSTNLEITQSLHCSVTAWSCGFGSLLNDKRSPKPTFSECRYGNCVDRAFTRAGRSRDRFGVSRSISSGQRYPTTRFLYDTGTGLDECTSIVELEP